MIDVICVGEMVIDFLPGDKIGHYIRNAGGAPANVAIAVARNELSSGFIGMMGDDDFGRFLVATLQENNVKVLCKNLTKEAVTTMAFVTLDEHGDRSFTFARKPGADMLLNISDINPDWIKDCLVVHAGSCSLSASPAAEATRYALQLGKKYQKIVSFDVNYRNLLWDNCETVAVQKILDLLPLVDMLKISEEETAMFGGEDNIGRLMSDNNIALIIETLGPKGAKAFWRDIVIELPGLPGKAVDTTGAGDAFWGAFLSSLLNQGVRSISQLTEEIIRNAMVNGNVAGILCVRKKGAISSLPTRSEIQEYLKSEGAI